MAGWVGSKLVSPMINYDHFTGNGLSESKPSKIGGLPHHVGCMANHSPSSCTQTYRSCGRTPRGVRMVLFQPTFHVEEALVQPCHPSFSAILCLADFPPSPGGGFDVDPPLLSVFQDVHIHFKA